MRRGRPPHPERLTPREQEVLDLLREGLTNQEIADRLGISRAGAAYHVGEILSKLNVSTRQDAAALEPELVRRRAWGLAGFVGFLNRAPVGSIMKLSGIAAIAGGLGLVVLLAIGTGITQLRSDLSADLDCVTGEAAENDMGARGRENLRQEFLATIGEVEAFLCIDLPSIDLTPAWRTGNFITAVRSNSLAQFEPGEWIAEDGAYKHVEIYFFNDDLNAFLTLMIYPTDLSKRRQSEPICQPPRSDGVVESIPVTVQGISTTLWMVPHPPSGAGAQSTAAVCWDRDSLTFFAGMGLPRRVNVLTEVLPLLESFR